MIEVFKTNVQQQEAANRLTKDLLARFPANRINFDLHDCDNILRIEGESFSAEQVISVVNACGYQAAIL